MPLYDTPLYDGAPYDLSGSSVPVYLTDLVVFDGFSISDGTTYVLQEKPEIGPRRDLIGGDTPRDHGQYLSGDYFRRTELVVEGYIKVATADDLLPAIDAMKKALRPKQRSLDITENGTVRRYVATVTNFEEMFAGRKGYHITICPFIVRFECRTPFGTDRESDSTGLTITTSPSNHAVYHAGTADAKPVITLIFDSASSVTAANVQRIDPATGDTLEEIEYSGSIAANDILVFDASNKRVTFNGTQVKFTGSFLTLPAGGSLLKFTITGSSFSVITTISHLPTYL